MLELIAALAVLSGLILIGVLFRPTPAQIAVRAEAARARESQAFLVLGAFPTREAIESYETVMRRAAQEGVTIDWDRVRREQTTASGPRQTLSAIALQQL